MKRVILSFLILFCSILLVSCQPTPDEPFVVSKNDGKLEAVIYGDAAKPGKYGAPEAWEEDLPAFDTGGTVKISAKITVPSVEKYPVYQVDSPAAIDQKYADYLLDYFVGDEKLYKHEAPEMTKNDIIQEIMKLESEINDPDSKFNTIEKSQVTDKEFQIMVEYRKNRIKELEGEYASAPEVAHREEVSRKLSPQYDETGNIIRYSIDGITDTRVYFHIRSNNEKTDKNRSAVVALLAKGGQMYPAARFKDISDMKGLKCTPEEAQSAADTLLNDLGKSGYSMKIISAVTAYESESEEDATILDYKRTYRLYYTRDIEGIPCLIASNERENYIDYQDPWPQELISVGVSDEGACLYSESSGFELKEKLNENVPLLSFEAIQQKFRDYIAISVSYFGDYDGATHHVTIDDIRLGFYMIRQKNNPQSGYLIPVWMFYGNEVWHYQKQPEGGVLLDENNNYMPYDNIAHSYLCINAIDGSIIDLSQGY